MLLFDFLRRILGWADEGSRKRKADEHQNPSDYCTGHKKRKGEIVDLNVNEDIIMNDDTDSDIEVLTDIPKQLCSINRSNGTLRSRQNMAGTSNSRFPVKKSTQNKPLYYTNSYNNRSNMRHYETTEPRKPRVDPDCKCQTLSKTQQLKEKSQYKEMLQNFVPRRIHVLQNKPTELIPEIIQLDTTEQSLAHSSKYYDSFKNTSTPMVARFATRKTRISIDQQIPQDTSKIFSVEKKCFVPRKKLDKPVEENRVPSIYTNSLRDKLSAKSVIRQDFVSKIHERYNERIEPWYKEVEEVTKKTRLLSKANRVSREAALEEQLARSMRLCEAVIDETEEPEELPLPTLKPEMVQKVKQALVPRPPDEVLVESFALRITRKDLNTLADLNWLNDEVINFYMNLLISRSTDDRFPNVHAMNTFFIPKLLSSGHSSLKRWTRRIDIFSKDIIVVPVHLGIHWCMSIIDFRDKTIRYYDSMGNPNQKCLLALKQYLSDESMDKKKKVYNTNDWKLESVGDIPQQMNGSDCGVFSCMFAEYICANRKITFSQQDMPYFRTKMAYEILTCKLL